MLSLYYGDNEDEIQVGIDEAGKGCMIGPVYAAAVIWNNRDLDVSDIKDSKKISRKKRAIVREYIEKNATAYGVGSASQKEIDEMNISNATYLAMFRALDQINVPFDRIVVDGNLFKPYKCNLHTCVVGGDNKYVSIAAASILAKEYHDEWITQHFGDDTKYDLMNNKGYGTAKHMKGLEAHGLCDQHRRSYCKRFL
jgi:ribonuclease HII